MKEVEKRKVVIIVPTRDVQSKKNEGYRMVNIDELKDGEPMKGNVLDAMLGINAWTHLQLAGGYIESTRLCDDKTCQNNTMQFSLKHFGTKHAFLEYFSYAIMVKRTGNHSLTNRANVNWNVDKNNAIPLHTCF